MSIELVEGSIFCGTNTPARISGGTGALKLPYSQRPSLGDPIGSCDVPGPCGTLGGFVQLFKESDPSLPIIDCALTCRHVAYPSPGEEASSDIPCELSKQYYISQVLISPSAILQAISWW